MSRKARTKLEDIAAVGEELQEEHLRLANGGLIIVVRLCYRTVGTNDPIRRECRLDRVLVFD